MSRVLVRVAAILASGAIAPLATGCGSGGGYAPSGLVTTPRQVPAAPTGPASALIVMRNVAFTPTVVHVKLGAEVKWRNDDPVVHNVTSLDGTTISSGNLQPGVHFAYKATQLGTISYYCTLHPSAMHGEIVVSG